MQATSSQNRRFAPIEQRAESRTEFVEVEAPAPQTNPLITLKRIPAERVVPHLATHGEALKNRSTYHLKESHMNGPNNHREVLSWLLMLPGARFRLDWIAIACFVVLVSLSWT